MLPDCAAQTLVDSRPPLTVLLQVRTSQCGCHGDGEVVQECSREGGMVRGRGRESGLEEVGGENQYGLEGKIEN